jgi:hypothetical protein
MHDWGDMLVAHRLRRAGDGHGADHAQPTTRPGACSRNCASWAPTCIPSALPRLRGRALARAAARSAGRAACAGPTAAHAHVRDRLRPCTEAGAARAVERAEPRCRSHDMRAMLHADRRSAARPCRSSRRKRRGRVIAVGPEGARIQAGYNSRLIFGASTVADLVFRFATVQGQAIHWFLRAQLLRDAGPARAGCTRRCACRDARNRDLFSGSRGPCLILPFAWLELAAVGVAFVLYARHAADGEHILLSQGGRLVVELENAGRLERAEFNRDWVRVEPAADDRSLIEVSGPGAAGDRGAVRAAGTAYDAGAGDPQGAAGSVRPLCIDGFLKA